MAVFYLRARVLPHYAFLLAGVMPGSLPSFAQQSSDSAAAGSPATAGESGAPIAPAPEKAGRHIIGVLPNYRTSNPLDVYEPLTTRQKFTIAAKDSLDWSNFLMSAGFAGLYQLQNANPDFGQGLKGYAHRYWTSLVDQSTSNLMTEAVMPSLLHEDPRYFRKVTGSTKRRLGYSLTRVLVTRTDSGGSRFNFSEILGNGAMASLGNVYYPGSRGLGGTMERLGLQVGTDAFSNVLKEFWPDMKRRFSHKHVTAQLDPAGGDFSR